MLTVFNHDVEKEILFRTCQEIQTQTTSVIDSLLSSNKEKTKLISPLISFIKGRMNTVILLAKQENYIDSDIIMRSQIECLMKFFYIVYNNEPTIVGERINEFWEILPEISKYYDSIRMRDIIKTGSANHDALLLKSIVLTKEEEGVIVNKYSIGSKTKGVIDIGRKLTGEWGFGALIKIMENSVLYKGRQVFVAKDMANRWVHTSEFSHASATALKAIQDREAKIGDYKKNSLFMHILSLAQMSTLFYLWTAILLAEFLNKQALRDELINNSKAGRTKLKELISRIEQEVVKHPHYTQFKPSS